jgi:hypothetical protein
MAHDEKPANKQSPPIDDSLIINTRLIALEREQAEEKKRDAAYKTRQLLFNGLTVLFTFCLVVTNVIYDAFTLDIARQAKTSADAAKSAAETAQNSLKAYDQSFRQEQRAYLWASSFNMSNPPICAIPGRPRVCADVHIVNSGKTPANGVHIHRYAAFGPNALRTIAAMKVPEYTSPSGDVLGTTGDKWGTAATDTLDDTTAHALIESRTPLYVYGVVQYFDICQRRNKTAAFSPVL